MSRRWSKQYLEENSLSNFSEGEERINECLKLMPKKMFRLSAAPKVKTTSMWTFIMYDKVVIIYRDILFIVMSNVLGLHHDGEGDED